MPIGIITYKYQYLLYLSLVLWQEVQQHTRLSPSGTEAINKQQLLEIFTTITHTNTEPLSTHRQV